MSVNKKQISSMEEELVRRVKKVLGKNLITLLVEGSYAGYDFVPDYSDFDLLALVKDVKQAKDINFTDLEKKYGLEIQCAVKSYSDFLNRIKNNKQATRFISNLLLIKYKKQARLLSGRNVIKLIPPLSQLIQRDLKTELRSNYLYAVNPDKRWNIFGREPRKWCNYIINMANDLLLSKGIVAKKDQIPGLLLEFWSGFKGLKYVRHALLLRKTKNILSLTKSEQEQFKNELRNFLVEYKKIVF